MSRIDVPVIQSVEIVATLSDGSTQRWTATTDRPEGINVDVTRHYPRRLGLEHVESFEAELTLTKAKRIEGPRAPSLNPPVALENVQLMACTPVIEDDGRHIYVTTMHGFLPDGQMVEADFRTDSLVYPAEGRERR